MRGVAAGMCIASVALLSWALGTGTTVHAAPDEAATPEFYTNKVLPILKENCYACHGGENHRGGLSLATRSGMLKGGHDGPVLVPGDPKTSLIVRLIRHEGPANDPMPMPPKKPKISDDNIATIERWVKAGAVVPDDAK
jgi:cytochrome c